jgi:hypothetical protein
MAQQLELYELCPQCKGTGVFQSAHGEGSSSMTCNWPGCNGSGYIYYAKLTLDPGIDDVETKCDTLISGGSNILQKCNDIDDKTDTLIGDRPTILEKFNTIISKCNEILALLS